MQRKALSGLPLPPLKEITLCNNKRKVFYMRRLWNRKLLLHKAALPHLPLLLFMLFMFVTPLVLMLNDSFRNYNYARPSNLGAYVGVQNYSKVLHNSAFWQSVGRLVTFVMIALTAEMVLGIVLAHVLKDIKHSRPLLSILLIPTMAAPIVVGLLGRFVFNNSFGIVPSVIELVFGTRPMLLSVPILAYTVLATVEIWHWTPLLTLIFYSGLISLPQDPYDAAKVDGASFWQAFRYLTLPMLMPVIVAGIIIRGIDLFKIFDEILVMTGGGPGTATELLNFFIYKTAFRSWNVGHASAIGVIMVTIMLPVVYIFYNTIGGGREAR